MTTTVRKVASAVVLLAVWEAASRFGPWPVWLLPGPWEVALASRAGVRDLNPVWVRAARTMGAKGLTLYTTVLLPASLPALLNGAKLGWTFAWRSLLAAELLYAGGGLGQLLQQGRELNDVS